LNNIIDENNKDITNNVEIVKSKSIYNKSVSNNFEFSIDENDIIFILTSNGSFYKENVIRLHCKLTIINKFNSVNLDDVSKVLSFMNIERLNIFSINDKLNTINSVISEKYSKIIYTETKSENFIEFLNYEGF
jgi:hypothetical protein